MRAAKLLLLIAALAALPGCVVESVDPALAAIEHDLARVAAEVALRKPMERYRPETSAPAAPVKPAPVPPVAPAPPPPAPVGAEIAWRDNYATGLAEQQATGKPLLLWFYLPAGCNLCEEQKLFVHTNPDFCAEVGEYFVPVKVDGSRNRNFAGQFGVRAFPQTVVLHQNGSRFTAEPTAIPVIETNRLRSWR